MLIDWRTGQKMRFYVATRREIRQYASYCVGCGEKVADHEGPWIYGMVSLDDVLCKACGELYAPEVMRELRKYYDYVATHKDAEYA